MVLEPKPYIVLHGSVDQQLRQQQALQQLGMIQQDAWSLQRGFPERSLLILCASYLNTFCSHG
ncbi:hypothetical protein MKX01_021522, partial [Papaver californicum]